MQTTATAVVAVKPWSRAKSRLAPIAEPDRPRLVQAMLLDTCSALVAAGCGLVLVSDQPGLSELLRGHRLPATVRPDPGGGLNAALAAGAEAAGARTTGADTTGADTTGADTTGADTTGADTTAADTTGAATTGAPTTTVLAVVSDLPCLDAAGVSAVLGATTAPGGRWFVPDLSGVGTTMLLARGEPLAPAFEGASARRHQGTGARALDAPEGVRLDVDDEASLVRALAHGVGARTAAWADGQPWLTPAPGPGHRYLPVPVDGARPGRR